MSAQLTLATYLIKNDIEFDLISSIRGSLNAIMDPAYNIGMLLGFVIANYFNYVDQAKFHLILPAVFLVIFSQIPDSPQHLMNTQRHKVRVLTNKAPYFKSF